MTEKKRLASIELLRIIAMVMVVVLHFLRESGTLPVLQGMSDTAGAGGWSGLSATGIAAAFLESFCIVAVNTYVLISGYFGCESRPGKGKALSFLLQIWFYSLLIPAVLAVLSVPTAVSEMGIYGLIQYWIPIESESYWFATAYFFLLLLMPFLNAGISALSRKQFTGILLMLLVFTCLVKSICPVALAFDKYGYDLLWFLVLYLVGAWLKKYGGSGFQKHGGALYLGSCTLIFGMTLLLFRISQSLAGTAYYFTVPWHYNFVFCLTGAAGLLGLFLKLPVREGRGSALIRRLGGYSFGIYLFHEHVDLRNRWYPFLKKCLAQLPLPLEDWDGSLWGFFIELIFCVTVLFAVGLFIEWIRTLLFQQFRKLSDSHRQEVQDAADKK